MSIWKSPGKMLDRADRDFGSLTAKAIEGSRRDINRYVATVPQPAKNELHQLVEHFCSSPLRGVQKIILALAFDLGLREERSFCQINTLTLLGILHTVMLDDIVDNKSIGPFAHIRNVYLSHIVFNFYVEEWLKLYGAELEQKHFAEFRRIEVETYSALFDEEINHVDVSRSYGSGDIVALKCSPTKAVASHILRLAGREEAKQEVFSILDRASFAVCALDDMFDWEEDYERRRFTYPLQRSLDYLGIPYEPNRHNEIKMKVLRALCYSVLYHELMKEIECTFEDCGKRAESISHRLASWLYEYRDMTNASWREHVQFLATADSTILSDEMIHPKKANC